MAALYPRSRMLYSVVWCVRRLQLRREQRQSRGKIQRLAELRGSLTRAARFATQSNCGAEDSLMPFSHASKHRILISLPDVDVN